MIVAELLSQVALATNNARHSKGVTAIGIVNEALEYFNSMHAWDSLVVPEVTLDTVASQDYVVLPNDVRDVIALTHNGGENRWIKWVEPLRLTELRSYDDDDQDYVGGYYVAIERANPTTGGGLETRLGIYPQPGSSTAGAFSLRYRRLILPVGIDTSPDTEFIRVESFLRPMLKQLVRIFARGIEEYEEGEVYERLEMFTQSRMVSDAKAADAAMQPEVGQLRGGAAQHVPDDKFWWDSAVTDPS